MYPSILGAQQIFPARRGQPVFSILHDLVHSAFANLWLNVTLQHFFPSIFRSSFFEFQSMLEFEILLGNNKLLTFYVSGFKTIYKPKVGGVRFADLLDRVSLVDPEMRIRFISPHPKDFPDEVRNLQKRCPLYIQSVHCN